MLGENGETEMLEPILRRHGSEKGDKGNEARWGAAARRAHAKV